MTFGNDTRGSATRVLVLGSGVIGLTCAIAILESNQSSLQPKRDVWIWTEHMPLNTTSVVAGAIWGPYHVEPQDKCDRWAMESVPIFDQICNEEENARGNGHKGSQSTLGTNTGVYRASGYVYERGEHQKPSWLPGNEQLFRYSRKNHQTSENIEDNATSVLDNNDYIRNEFQSVYELDLPMIDMSIYLTYLEKRFYRAGGRGIIQRKLTHIDQVSQFERDTNQKFDMVVNCTGFGSRHLFNDRQVVADRGQLVLIRLPTDKPGVFGADALRGRYYDAEPKPGNQPTYILPRANNIYICGGCSIVLSDEEMGDDSRPSNICTDMSGDILKRCNQLVPHAHILSTAQIVEHVAAWRPYRRGGVRLELSNEGTEKRPVIHCYGFGGAGVTLSWVCNGLFIVLGV